MAAAEVEGRIWVTGGSRRGLLKADTTVLSAALGERWLEAAPMLQARNRHGAVGLGSRLYVIGGWGDERCVPLFRQGSRTRHLKP
jgi:hypothetical protein